MRAMMSDQESRVDELAYRYECCLGDGALAAGVVAGLAADEARRILTDAEPEGGQRWSAPALAAALSVREWQRYARPGACLAEALRAITADGGPLDQLAAESRIGAIVGADWHGQAIIAGVVARNEARQ